MMSTRRRHMPSLVTGGLAACALLGLLTTACTSGAEVTREELIAMVERDATAFTAGEIPDQVLDHLDSHRVVVLGETHHLREHWEFTAALLGDLHASGFRQLLVEQPQMVDWLLDDWVVDGGLAPDWVPPPHLERKFVQIRDLNATLPPEERIHVRSIDVNEEYYGGAGAFLDIMRRTSERLPEAGPLGPFLEDYAGTPGSLPVIESLLAALEADRTSLTASWGASWFDTIVEMTEVERESIDIRAERRDDDDRAARHREEIIKRLADTRIAGSPTATVVNIGGHHAQKAHLKGTEQEWLGDYLVHRSPAAEGSVYVVSFSSAKTELLPGASGTPFDVVTSSPEHELLRVIAETHPGRTVFLPFDDPMFAERTIAVNSEDTIYVAVLEEHYDAVIQYGLAHRWPSG